MIVPLILETSSRKKISSAGVEIQVDSESKRMTISEWEEKLGLTTPFTIRNCKIDPELIDGKKSGQTVMLNDTDSEADIDGIRFRRHSTNAGTCYGIKIDSDTGHGVKIRLTLTLDINRRDVKPAFILEREGRNG